MNTESTDEQRSQEKEHKESIDRPNLESHGLVQQQELQLEISGAKRAHSLEGSDSDKDQPAYSEENQLVVFDPTINTRVLRKVEKKKGRK